MYSDTASSDDAVGKLSERLSLFIASLAFGGGLAFAARAYARTHEGISRL